MLPDGVLGSARYPLVFSPGPTAGFPSAFSPHGSRQPCGLCDTFVRCHPARALVCTLPLIASSRSVPPGFPAQASWFLVRAVQLDFHTPRGISHQLPWSATLPGSQHVFSMLPDVVLGSARYPLVISPGPAVAGHTCSGLHATPETVSADSAPPGFSSPGSLVSCVGSSETRFPIKPVRVLSFHQLLSSTTLPGSQHVFPMLPGGVLRSARYPLVCSQAPWFLV
jgi:hypothetical protein